MILNVFGPSGSGKTTLVKKLLKNESIISFFGNITNEKCNNNLNNKVSISLIPLPNFKGTVKDFFNIFSIDINILLTLDQELSKLSESIFSKINDERTLEKISMREIETFSAGELRRLFILKSLLVNSSLFVIDEPFSNSDSQLWDTIYNALNQKDKILILSHLSLSNLLNKNNNNVSIHISDVSRRFLR